METVSSQQHAAGGKEREERYCLAPGNMLAFHCMVSAKLVEHSCTRFNESTAAETRGNVFDENSLSL